jgi:hypothetical protein
VPGGATAVVIYFRRIYMKDGTETHFLNVDLELRAERELTELVQAFEPGAMALNCMALDDGYLANLELATQPTEAEAAIRSFVNLIDKLPERARVLWNEASRRDFSIGIEAGSTPSSFELALTPAVLKLAADVGARITVVIYAYAPASAPSA